MGTVNTTNSGGFNVSGLISGLDTNSIIQQLMAVDQQPITNLQNQIATLQKQQSDENTLNTQLLALCNDANNFQLGSVFGQYETASSDPTVLAADVSSSAPVVGSYQVDVSQLATATVATSSAPMGSPVNPDATLASSGMGTQVTAGTFTVNGVSFTVDPATQTLNQVLAQITNSSAGVNATYSATTDEVTFANKTAGNTGLINFGASGDTSNFLDALSVTDSMQENNNAGATQAVSTLNLGSVNPSEKLSNVNFASGPVTAGTFFVNGVSISVNPATDTLSDVLQRINNASTQVTTTYDSSSDKIHATATTLGSRTISFTAGTSNFLTAANLAAATQTPGDDAQFTVNGGALQSRNTNQVSDAVNGVTLHLLSTGTSSVTISNDNDATVSTVNQFITDFNNSINMISSLTANGGDLANDGTVQNIANYLQGMIFGSVPGSTGSYTNLLDVGVSTGSTFNAASVPQLQLDQTAFLAAIQADPSGVAAIFSNTNKTGIMDQLYSYMNGITGTSGFLYDQTNPNGEISKQIANIKSQINVMQDSVTQKEARMQQEFLQMEELENSYKTQGNALSSLATTTL